MSLSDRLFEPDFEDFCIVDSPTHRYTYSEMELVNHEVMRIFQYGDKCATNVNAPRVPLLLQ